MAGRIENELGRRQAQEEEDAAGNVLENHTIRHGGPTSGRWCAVVTPSAARSVGRGEKHGPYLYRYAYKDGRRVSEYIRLKDAERLGFSRPILEKA